MPPNLYSTRQDARSRIAIMQDEKKVESPRDEEPRENKKETDRSSNEANV